MADVVEAKILLVDLRRCAVLACESTKDRARAKESKDEGEARKRNHGRGVILSRKSLTHAWRVRTKKLQDIKRLPSDIMKAQPQR